MNKWNLDILYFGKMLVPPEYLFKGIESPVDTPYCGFLARQGNKNILIDCGVSEDNFGDYEC